jgi:acyl dehydratase
MKQIKQFDSKKELNDTIKALEAEGINCEYSEVDFLLFVHVGDFIKARDVILEKRSNSEQQTF